MFVIALTFFPKPSNDQKVYEAKMLSSGSAKQTSISAPLSNPSKSFSISLPNPKPKHAAIRAPKPLNPKKRPHSSLADSDSDNDHADSSPQLVSSFDHSAGGAIGINGVNKTKAPLIVQGQKNRDWREESRRRRKNLLPAEVQAAKIGEGLTGQVAEEKNDAPQEFGLTFVEKVVKDMDGDVAMIEAQVAMETSSQGVSRPKNEDEEALEALVGNNTKKSTLVLPALGASDSGMDKSNGRFNALAHEDDSFRSDVASRPDSANLDEYAAVPVEEFGAALLRGMGWKEGDVVGKRKDQISTIRIVERRPALLGIGAKEVPGGVGDELGAWGKVTTKGKRKVDKSYNPVLLRNSKTGETLTEEELEAKQEERRKANIEWRERRDRNLAIDEGKKSVRRRGDKPRSIEEARHSSSSRRARSRSTDESRPRSSRHRSRSTDIKKHSASRRARSRSRSSDRKPRSSSHRRQPYDNLDLKDREPSHSRKGHRMDEQEESRSSKRDREKDRYDSNRRKDWRDDSRASEWGHTEREREDFRHEDTRRRKRQEVF